MKTILLKLAGPLQSWGTDSRYETRTTDRYPSKSGIVGMIAAALGYRRDESEKLELLNSIEFAVRVDQQGTLLRDYHIASKHKKNGKLDRTYVTNRYYLQDAVFVVALGSKNQELMTEIEQSLKSPYFQLFLGRRSLPLNVDFFIKTTTNGVIESLAELPWQASYWHRKKYRNESKIGLDVYADSSGKKGKMVKDVASSFSQHGRVHLFRSVSKLSMDVSVEHDAFLAIGG